MENHRTARRAVIESLGGSAEAAEQLLDYNENPFDLGQCTAQDYPLPDESHLQDWREYAAESGPDAFAFLQDRLPQLCFPIREGVSSSDAYAAVIRRGQPFSEADAGGKLQLSRPDLFKFIIREHPAGAQPILMTTHREDFEAIDRALAFRSEPEPMNPSVNAHLIAGLINWDRVHRYKSAWIAKNIFQANKWPAEMQRVAKEEKERFYDRLMLICINPYSGVDGPEIGVPEEGWLDKSCIARIEHEFTHYTTIRLFDSMRLNMLDEIICDWAGLTEALGDFKSRQFLYFLGLQKCPEIRESGRVHAYRGGLGDEAFSMLATLTVQAAQGLEALSAAHYKKEERFEFLLTITQMTLELFAADDREQFFFAARDAVRQHFAD